jgi:hypothetical protein
MSGRIIRVKKDRPPNPLHGKIIATGLVCNDTEMVQRVCVVGSHGENLSVERLGCGKSPGLVVLEGEFEGLLDRYNWHAEIADGVEGSGDGSA